ncbi:MAG: FecR family protein [Odoribacteraceae bacterium]|jgi:ferric-dicitrate binding protein FerR (iron transport regulator)|nr:FecR family protein [Odoribacteraceae bacterium]
MDSFIEETIIACLQGKSTREQEDNLRAWIDESEENRAAYERFCAEYYRLNYAGAWREINERQARRRIFTGKARPSRQPWYLSSAAAAVLLTVGIGWLAWPNGARELPALSTELVQGGARKATLILNDGTAVTLSPGSVVDVGYARAEDDSSSGLTYRSLEASSPARVEYNTLVVPRGGIYLMTFSDGTRAWLNAETSVRYPVVFEGRTREIFMDGEIFLEVAKDSERPFIVHTATTTTRVTGTSFNVMAYPGERVTEITLASGKVTVNAGDATLALLPGEQARVDNASLETTKHAVNRAYYTSWRAGLFDFDGMNLEELCTRLGRWYNVDFVFVSPPARSRTFTGAVKRDNNLQFMLDFIEKTSNVRFEIKGATIEVHDL